MSEFSWKVISVDHATAHMVIEYTSPTKVVQLNLPLPKAGVELAVHVSLYAPAKIQVEHYADVPIGSAGEIQFTETLSEAPNTIGNWNEEYIRAMIYQVLEEVRESTV